MAAWAERFSLAGRKALVTGASKGLGVGICEVFADAGADIVAVARDREGLEATRALVEGKGRRCLVIEADMMTPEGPVEAARRALAEWGTIDILVANAGITRLAPATDLSVTQWDELMAVNLRAPFLLARELAPGMIAQKRGKVVMVSSQTGVVALDDHAAYAASKGGLNALTKSLCVEWARHNVQVNAICPTVVLTPMGRMVWGEPGKGGPMRARIPADRFAEVTEVADAALFLASDASGMVNGDLLMLDGGYTSL